jgi:hypothetical protein
MMKIFSLFNALQVAFTNVRPTTRVPFDCIVHSLRSRTEMEDSFFKVNYICTHLHSLRWITFSNLFFWVYARYMHQP